MKRFEREQGPCDGEKVHRFDENLEGRTFRTGCLDGRGARAVLRFLLRNTWRIKISGRR